MRRPRKARQEEHRRRDRDNESASGRCDDDGATALRHVDQERGAQSDRRARGERGVLVVKCINWSRQTQTRKANMGLRGGEGERGRAAAHLGPPTPPQPFSSSPAVVF